jgi:rhamnogalacturonan acetylesterase
MKSFSACFAAALATVAVAAPVENYEERATTATPKVYLAGDSTMALGGGGTGTEGTLPLSFTFPN